ncbi:MAG: hypothetical protein NTX88_04940, partial [Candidatus Atribacteria bacterium]|nr:hypothetical protein [Candidatus Atribacteria bacterium]
TLSAILELTLYGQELINKFYPGNTARPAQLYASMLSYEQSSRHDSNKLARALIQILIIEKSIWNLFLPFTPRKTSKTSIGVVNERF